MSRQARQTAAADFQALRSHPDQLAQRMEQHQHEGIYLSEIVELAGRNFGGLKKGAGKHGGIFDKAAHEHDQVQDARKRVQSTGNKGELLLAIEHFGWVSTGAEVIVEGLAHRNQLEGFARFVGSNFAGPLGVLVGKATQDGLIGASTVVGFQGLPWDSPQLRDGSPRPPGITSTVEQGAQADLVHAQHELRDAENKLASLDRELATQLNGDHIAATLDPKAKAKFIEHFHERADYKEAMRRLTAANTALGRTVQRDQSDVLAFAADGVDKKQGAHAAQTLLDTYNVMATAGGNAQFLARLAEHPPGPLVAHKRELQDIAERAWEIGSANVFEQLKETFEQAEHAEHGGGVHAVLAKVKHTLVDPFDAFTQFENLRNVSQQIVKADHLFRSFLKNKSKLDKAGKAAALREVVAAFEAPHGRAAVRVAKGLALFVAGAAEIGELAAGGEVLPLMAEFLEHSRRFLEVAKLGKHADKLGAAGKQVAAAGKKLRALPVMGVAVGGLGLLEDGKEALHGDPASIVASVGDVVQIVGGAISAFPPLAPLGEAINIVGTAITFIARTFRGDPDGDKRRGEEQEALVDINAFGHDTPQLAKLFTDRDAKAALDITQHESPPWDHDQVRRVAVAFPFLFSEPHLMATANNLRKFYAQRNHGGLAASHTSSLFAFVTTAHGADNLKRAVQVASHSTFNVVPNADADMERAVFTHLHACFPDSEWSNNNPNF